MKTQVAAGTIRWGSWGAKLSTEKMTNLIEQCMSHGINTFDVSDVYGNYTTEREVGDAINQMGLKRKDFHLISKCGIIKPCSARPNYHFSHYDTSKEYIIQCVESSLNDLQVDFIDTYMIARPHYGMNYEGMAEAFAQLKKQGKIKRVGVVSFNGQQIRSLNKYIKVDEVQLELSLTHIESLQDGTVDVCQELGIDVFSWSPIGGGAIFTNTRAGRKLEERLAAVAQKNEWTLTEMALLFLSHIPANVTPIINQHKIEKYIEAVNTMSLSITNEQWFEILQASTGQEFS